MAIKNESITPMQSTFWLEEDGKEYKTQDFKTTLAKILLW